MPATGCAVRRCLHCRAPTAQRWKTLPASAKKRPGRMPILPGKPQELLSAARLDADSGRHQGPGRLQGVAAGPAFRCGCACSGSGHAFADGPCAGRRGKICAAAVRPCAARQRRGAADRPGALLCRRRAFSGRKIAAGAAPAAGRPRRSPKAGLLCRKNRQNTALQAAGR